jgi:hypothetical protein
VLNAPEVSPIKEIVGVRPTGLCVAAFAFSLRRILGWLAVGSRYERYDHVKHRRKVGALRRRRHLPVGDARRREKERGEKP